MARGEQGCRAGRKAPIEERLAAKDKARRELRATEMKKIGNWR